jgi:hypothetical protein
LAAGEFKNLQKINFSSNKITDEGLKVLAAVGGEFKNLQIIDLEYTKVTTKAV